MRGAARRLAGALVLALALWPVIAPAVTPDEMLSDPALEARARAISRELRCPVCQGETIDDSEAPIAADLRVLLRERLTAGDTDKQAVDYIVARYGEFVLFKPEAKGINLVLWVAGPVLLVLAIGLAGIAAARRRHAPQPAPLSAEETARLEEILKN